MVYDIIIGRSKKDADKFKTKGTILLGKQYVKMGATTSLSNPVYMDVSRSHVVLVCGKRGGGKCLHGDTLISLADGSQVPIKNLENNNQFIFSLNQDLKIQQTPKSQFYKRQINKLLKIRLRSGKEIKLTPEHPLFTVKGWMPAEKLHVGSRIATPRKIENFGNEFLSESKIKLIAYLLAEGHLNNSFVLFSNCDKTIVNDFKEAIREFDENLKIKIHSKENCFRVIENRRRGVIKQSERDEKGKFTTGPLIDSKSSLRKWLEQLKIYSQLAHQKIIPEIIFKLPKNKLILFLNRLFSCDGSIYKEGKNYWKISYSSSSKELIRQVQHLLLRFSIASKIRNKKTKRLPSYKIEIKGENVHTFLNEVGFFGEKEKKGKIALKEAPQIIRNPNIDTVPKEIWNLYKPDSWAEIGRKLHYTIPKSLRESQRYSPSRQKLMLIAKADENELLEKFATSDIFWDEITSIEMLEGSFTVYDITVPDHHNFVANDVIVHNSYTMGVISEGASSLPTDIAKNISFVLLDTMGIYWTMKYPNLKDEDLLEQWKLKPEGFKNVRIFTPTGFFKDYKEKGIPTDFPFSIKPNELDIEDWLLTFELPRNDPIAILIERIINKLKKEVRDFSMEDIVNEIRADKRSEKSVKDAAENRFLNAESWGLFSEKGTPLKDLIQGGKITVLDVSCYATAPNGWAIKSLVIGLVSKKLFIQRMVARRNEEFEILRETIHYVPEEERKVIRTPLVWLVIDEAHEFLPNKGKTSATDALVTILREGRQPGLSLILATQQPGKIHTDVMTQSDLIISHRLTAKIDIDALSMLMQSYMRQGLDVALDNLPRVKGSALVIDDQNERLFPLRVRPRMTWHGGEAPTALEKIKKKFS